VAIVVQINGKLRAQFSAPADSSMQQLEAEARANEKIKNCLDGKIVRKVVVVPKKLVNFVVAQ